MTQALRVTLPSGKFDIPLYIQNGNYEIHNSGALIVKTDVETDGKVMEAYIYAPGAWLAVSITQEEDE
jgi:hypothetical protein